MKKFLKKVIEKSGYSIHRNTEKKESENAPDIQDSDFLEIYELCKPYTMTSPERMYALYNSVCYIIDNQIQGSFTECGVWRGGSSMLIALTLMKKGVKDRKIYLYDTYEGMSEPGANDVDINGVNAAVQLAETSHDKENSVWCLAGIEDVRQNMKSTNYPFQNIIFIQGKVEETIPADIPTEPLALLRLDTDWYESTRHELEHLYPMVVKNGVLIIDDYGHWEGCRKAVDEYFARNGVKLLLNRIDYTGRVAIKTN